MNSNQLESLLVRWGRCFGQRPEREADEDRPGPAVHPLARAAEFAAGRYSSPVLLRRGGAGRRRLMATAAGIDSMRIVPGCFVSPVSCPKPHYVPAPVAESANWAPPVELMRVERAALDLLALHPTMGLCLRAKYCRIGPPDEKASWVSKMAGHYVKTREYRDQVRIARLWVEARLI